MNLWIVFKFKDCKLQFYEKQRLFSYFSVNPRTPASRWRRLLKQKRKKIDSFKIIIYHWLLFHPTTILGNKLKGLHFVCLLLAKNYQMHPKSLKSKKNFQESTNRASERASEWVSFSTSYLQLALAHARNSQVKKVFPIVSWDLRRGTDQPIRCKREKDKTCIYCTSLEMGGVTWVPKSMEGGESLRNWGLVELRSFSHWTFDTYREFPKSCSRSLSVHFHQVRVQLHREA